MVHIHKFNNAPNYLMMDLVWKSKSAVAYPHLVIRVIVYGISRFHNGVPLNVCDKSCERSCGTLNFLTFIKMTKELKIQDVVNDDNSTTKKVFHIITATTFHITTLLQ